MAGSVAVSSPPKRPSMWQLFAQMPLLVKICTIWLFLVVFGAIYAKLDATVFNGALPLQDPNLQTNNFDAATGEFGTGSANESWSASHWLGTDTIARDTFSRLVHGSWVSLVIALSSAGTGVLIGGMLGSLVGFVRGRTDTFVMASMDVILAFPAIVLLLVVVSIFEVRSLWVIAGIIAVLGIPAYTRVARANSLTVSKREFVMAARAIGTKPGRILLREVIPNVLPTMAAYAMVAAAFVIVVEGTLSFLGLSVQLPTSTWGNMLVVARGDIKINQAQVLWPALALVITVLSLNTVGDWLQKRFSHRDSAL